MSDQAALLAAVAADPDSDLPRLVYADWLDDHGLAVAAEYVRVQCELARLGGTDERFGPLLGRQQALAHQPDAFHCAQPPHTSTNSCTVAGSRTWRS